MGAGLIEDLQPTDKHVLVQIRKRRNDRPPGNLTLVSRSMKYSMRDRSVEKRPPPTSLLEHRRHSLVRRPEAAPTEQEDDSGVSGRIMQGTQTRLERRSSRHLRKAKRPLIEIKAELRRQWEVPLVNYGNKLA